ncbi:hypothetical protein [Agromyces italicus]|uniref:hypothetical protein n=1 Tax=Agromyces italicus TaxID=279572 RepID=UPI0003B5DD8E|nr:hypothetical protein [Agromyces italicus]
MSEPTQPWWNSDDDLGGLGFARMFAYTGLLLGAGALVIAVFAPLEGDALRTVWIAGFGCAAIWVAAMAVPRYRAAGVKTSWAVRTAWVLGGLAVLTAAYAFVAIWLASGGVELPAPVHWFTPERVPFGVTA